jgi:hypothetical protein
MYDGKGKLYGYFQGSGKDMGKKDDNKDKCLCVVSNVSVDGNNYYKPQHKSDNEPRWIRGGDSEYKWWSFQNNNS